jgi:hypothetical protein
MPTGRAITPELHIPESAAVAAGQPQPAHLAAQRRCPGAVDLGITAQAHHVAPALAALEPTEQLGAGEATIGQNGDAAETSQQLIGPLEQSDHHLGADAGTGMLERLPQQRDRPAVADEREHHDTTTVPQHRGVERQMQGVARLLPLLNRPKHQRAIEGFHADAFIAQPTPAAPLPAGG